MSGSGRDVLSDVRVWSGVPGDLWEWSGGPPDVWELSGDPREFAGVFVRHFRMSKSCQEAPWMSGSCRETHGNLREFL